MRRGSALVVSAAIHVVAVAGIGLTLQGVGNEAAPEQEPSASLQAETVPMEVVEVELVDVAAGRTPVAAGPLPVAVSRRPGAVGRTPEAVGRTPEAVGRTPEAVGRTLAEGRSDPKPEVRGPSPGALSTADIVARIAAERTPELPAAVTPSGKLHDTGGGRARIDDGVAPVIVDADGTAHFKPKPNFRAHLLPKLPRLGNLRQDIGKLLSTWYDDPYRVVHEAGRTQDLPEYMLAVPGACDHYGSCLTTPPDAPSSGDEGGDAGVLALLGGTFDVTDYAMGKLHAGDPYRARKQALLDSTLAERAERGASYRAEQLDRSAEMMRDNLAALWRTIAEPARRREALFELWDECAEGDDSAGAAGQRARGQVIGWIRAKLPTGSGDAYSIDEITRLSARRTSKQAFAPYD